MFRTASRRYVGPREGASLTKTKTALDPDLAACLEDVHQGGGALFLWKDAATLTLYQGHTAGNRQKQ